MTSTLQKRVVLGTVAGLLASGIACAPNARAEATPSEKVAAQTLFDEARSLVAAGRYAEACPKLEESERLDPTSGTLINLADCYEREGKTGSAWSTFLDAAAAAKATGRLERESAARDRAAALAPRLAKVVLSLGPNGSTGMQVQYDGAAVDPSRWSGIPIDPGSHVIVVTAPGKKSFRATVAPREEGDSIALALPRLEDDPTTATVTVPPSRNSRRTVAIVIGAAGVVGLGVGTAFGLISRSKHNDADDYCSGSLCRDPRGVDLKNQAISAGNVSTVAFIAGGIGVAAGATLWLTGRPKSQAPASSSPKIALVPEPGALFLRGAF